MIAAEPTSSDSVQIWLAAAGENQRQNLHQILSWLHLMSDIVARSQFTSIQLQARNEVVRFRSGLKNKLD
jgi:hypothetical protein